MPPGSKPRLNQTSLGKAGNPVADDHVIEHADVDQAERLLVIDQYTRNRETYGYLLAAAMLGHLHNGDTAMALNAWNTHAARLLRGKMPGSFLRFLYLTAKSRH